MPVLSLDLIFKLPVKLISNVVHRHELLVPLLHLLQGCLELLLKCLRRGASPCSP